MYNRIIISVGLVRTRHTVDRPEEAADHDLPIRLHRPIVRSAADHKRLREPKQGLAAILVGKPAPRVTPCAGGRYTYEGVWTRIGQDVLISMNRTADRLDVGARHDARTSERKMRAVAPEGMASCLEKRSLVRGPSIAGAN